MMKKYAILTTVEDSLTAFLLPVAYALKAEGMDVTLISCMSEEFYEKYSEEFTCHNIQMKRGFHFGSLLISFIEIFKIIKEGHFDCVEYATENVSFPASIASCILRVPVRIYDHWGARYVGLSGLSRKISWLLEKITANCSTTVRQVSEKNKALCVRDKVYSSEKCIVLGKGGTIGVDMKKFDVSQSQKWRKATRNGFGIPEDAVVLGFIGRIQKDKGINELLGAFRKLGRENCYLVLAGPIDVENSIDPQNMKYARTCQRIVFTGRISNVNEVVCAFDVLVHPTYREGFGMVLQEAAAMKIPIITTDIIGPNEFIRNGENGILVKPQSEDELKDAISKLIGNPEIRKSLAEQGYLNTKKYFEREIMVERIVQDRKKLIE